jgi:hypothetical protein
MNCKKGDLAIVTFGPHSGVVLTCIEPLSLRMLMPDNSAVTKAAWLTDRELEGCLGVKDRYVEDDILRPLRDPGDDAVDESAAWLPPVPTRDKVPA